MANRIRHLFNKYPFASNCIIYGSLYMTAECSQQIITKKFLVSYNLWCKSTQTTNEKLDQINACQRKIKPNSSSTSNEFACYLIDLLFISNWIRRNRQKMWIRQHWFVMASWGHFYTHRFFIHGQCLEIVIICIPFALILIGFWFIWIIFYGNSYLSLSLSFSFTIFLSLFQ